MTGHKGVVVRIPLPGGWGGRGTFRSGERCRCQRRVVERRVRMCGWKESIYCSCPKIVPCGHRGRRGGRRRARWRVEGEGPEREEHRTERDAARASAGGARSEGGANSGGSGRKCARGNRRAGGRAGGKREPTGVRACSIGETERPLRRATEGRGWVGGWVDLQNPRAGQRGENIAPHISKGRTTGPATRRARTDADATHAVCEHDHTPVGGAPLHTRTVQFSLRSAVKLESSVLPR